MFALTGLVVAAVLSLISVFAHREQARYLAGTNVFRMERTLVYVCVLMVVAMTLTASVLLVQAIYYHGRHGSDTEIPVTIGIVSACCAYVWSAYQVRLEDKVLRLGIHSRMSVPYSNIKEICEIRGQGSPRAALVTTSGQTFRIWSNLVGFDQLMGQLRGKCPDVPYRVIRRGYS